MSAVRSLSKNHKNAKDLKEAMRDLLDFGPDASGEEAGFSERVREILKKLQDISQRIDRLSSRLD